MDEGQKSGEDGQYFVSLLLLAKRSSIFQRSFVSPQLATRNPQLANHNRRPK